MDQDLSIDHQRQSQDEYDTRSVSSKKSWTYRLDFRNATGIQVYIKVQLPRYIKVPTLNSPMHPLRLELLLKGTFSEDRSETVWTCYPHVLFRKNTQKIVNIQIYRSVDKSLSFNLPKIKGKSHRVSVRWLFASLVCSSQIKKNPPLMKILYIAMKKIFVCKLFTAESETRKSHITSPKSRNRFGSRLFKD